MLRIFDRDIKITTMNMFMNLVEIRITGEQM